MNSVIATVEIFADPDRPIFADLGGMSESYEDGDCGKSHQIPSRLCCREAPPNPH